MVPERLEPRLDLLREEYVLVQAWKKTASYIRYHNWFSDTLALDRAAVNLPAFIDGLRERLASPESWQNDPLRIVPAPKRQRWKVREGLWEPDKGEATSARLRPLAHVSLADQVLATALMLCLADRVETLQGDPRQLVSADESRQKVVSYGNRLFCDDIRGELRHRWGSAKLYRKYYTDYQTFLSRSETAAEAVPATEGQHIFLVHTDLRQFYDRVRPDLLSAALERIRKEADDPEFFLLATSVLHWDWDSYDQTNVQMYAEESNLEDFRHVALPQGLVASGFFANVVLLSFDRALRSTFGREVAPGILLVDACRYVDDLRILIACEPASGASSSDVENIISSWLNEMLDERATGLVLSSEKTLVAALGGEERPLVRPSPRMNRIQSAVSGGFDALAGEEILDAIHGLMRAQEALSVGDDSGWRLSPVPDVRDETVARFGAWRYRTTFRSIRPLLHDDDTPQEVEVAASAAPSRGGLRVARTRCELDQDARAFALGLIQRWIDDPSNVRLLRIGLDLWPDVSLLRDILSLLRPFTENGEHKEAPQQVAWYCLSEILRAGATETGLVPDSDSLPAGIDLESYREELNKEAARLVSLPEAAIPWYLRQQALLFLAACDPFGAPVVRTGGAPETRHYQDLILFLRGEGTRLDLESSDLATLAVLTRRAFVDRVRATELTQLGVSQSLEREIARRDPSFLLELIDAERDGFAFEDLPARIREDLCRMSETADRDENTLAGVVSNAHPIGPLRNELSLLHFALAFLEQWEQQEFVPEVITPSQVKLKLADDQGVAKVENLQILQSRTDATGSIYQVAEWCKAGEQWRLQLGFLMRFILSGQPDFTRSVHRPSWKETESAYRPAGSSWYQRLYGLYSGQAAFGDDWLPITDWLEGFLFALLRWPGCRAPEGFDWTKHGIEQAKTQIGVRIAYLERLRGRATRALILPLSAKRPTATNSKRPLRACVVQTALPTADDFRPTDLPLNDSTIRRRHRNHLSAALAAVERLLALRRTHKDTEGRLDWLILPELAVHPRDVRTHLVPFARNHKTMILAGLTYEELFEGQPLVNSALWVIPELGTYGLQMRIRRQGKAHLAPDELAFTGSAGSGLQGFRPCQWLIGYPWSNAVPPRPVWLTGAICYDATDLGLVTDLRDVSDVLAIPALNKDVKTFDQMALALHYHMFQLVIVANNGQYGGSNAYWPRRDARMRQVFHSHGQPQASIAFFEIDKIGAFLERGRVSAGQSADWKQPPAGLNVAAP